MYIPLTVKLKKNPKRFLFPFTSGNIVIGSSWSHHCSHIAIDSPFGSHKATPFLFLSTLQRALFPPPLHPNLSHFLSQITLSITITHTQLENFPQKSQELAPWFPRKTAIGCSITRWSTTTLFPSATPPSPSPLPPSPGPHLPPMSGTYLLVRSFP